MHIKECGENIVISIQCIKCEKDFDILVHEADYEAWRNGVYAQDAFPYHNAATRELLISQICGKCFDKMCAEIDNEY